MVTDLMQSNIPVPANTHEGMLLMCVDIPPFDNGVHAKVMVSKSDNPSEYNVLAFEVFYDNGLTCGYVVDTSKWERFYQEGDTRLMLEFEVKNELYSLSINFI